MSWDYKFSAYDKITEDICYLIDPFMKICTPLFNGHHSLLHYLYNPSSELRMCFWQAYVEIRKNINGGITRKIHGFSSNSKIETSDQTHFMSNDAQEKRGYKNSKGKDCNRVSNFRWSLESFTSKVRKIFPRPSDAVSKNQWRATSMKSQNPAQKERNVNVLPTI